MYIIDKEDILFALRLCRLDVRQIMVEIMQQSAVLLWPRESEPYVIARPIISYKDRLLSDHTATTEKVCQIILTSLPDDVKLITLVLRCCGTRPSGIHCARMGAIVVFPIPKFPTSRGIFLVLEHNLEFDGCHIGKGMRLACGRECGLSA